MIIDFHTHVFPDKIAEKTIAHLASLCGCAPFANGTVLGLEKQIENAKIDLAIALPVITNPHQFDSVNRFAKEINDKKGKILSFGGIHPLCEDIPSKMQFLKEQGFIGVKIHPQYQNTNIDTNGYYQILSCAKELDLIVIVHSGVDEGFKNDPVLCSPKDVLSLQNKVNHPKFVLAHYGANRMWQETLEVLCGQNFYFDTSYALGEMGKETFLKILNKHGEDKILFATDCPWRDIKTEVNLLKEYVQNKDTLDKIFYKNAQKLLNV